MENYDEKQILTSKLYSEINNYNPFSYYSLRYGLYNGFILDIEHFIWDDSKFCHYNDLIHSSCYFPLHIISEGTDPIALKDSFHIGHEVYCMYDEYHEISHDDANYMVCECCGAYNDDEDRYVWCDICGERMERDYDAYHYLEYEDYYLCPHCAESQATVCHYCGMMTMNRNMKIGTDGNPYCPCCEEYMPIIEEEEEKEDGSSECKHRGEEELHNENH